ncbi:MAG TPA: hypothetical protein ENI73_03415 [Spirochaetes bacterium]|nr:hypothetical protein [Spirochaetota bacterium]
MIQRNIIYLIVVILSLSLLSCEGETVKIDGLEVNSNEIMGQDRFGPTGVFEVSEIYSPLELSPSEFTFMGRIMDDRRSMKLINSEPCFSNSNYKEMARIDFDYYKNNVLKNPGKYTSKIDVFSENYQKFEAQFLKAKSIKEKLRVLSTWPYFSKVLNETKYLIVTHKLDISEKVFDKLDEDLNEILEAKLDNLTDELRNRLKLALLSVARKHIDVRSEYKEIQYHIEYLDKIKELTRRSLKKVKRSFKKRKKKKRVKRKRKKPRKSRKRKSRYPSIQRTLKKLSNPHYLVIVGLSLITSESKLNKPSGQELIIRNTLNSVIGKDVNSTTINNLSMTLAKHFLSITSKEKISVIRLGKWYVSKKAE